MIPDNNDNYNVGNNNDRLYRHTITLTFCENSVIIPQCFIGLYGNMYYFLCFYYYYYYYVNGYCY